MAITTDELKQALGQLAKQEPQALQQLLGGVLTPDSIKGLLAQLAEKEPGALQGFLAGAFGIEPAALDRIVTIGNSARQREVLDAMLARLVAVAAEVSASDQAAIITARDKYVLPLELALQERQQRNEAILAPLRALRAETEAGQTVELPVEEEVAARLRE